MIKNAMEKSWHGWVKSAVITFITGFAIIIVPQIDTITLESFKDGTFIGILFIGVRQGIKMVLELLISAWHQ